MNLDGSLRMNAAKMGKDQNWRVPPIGLCTRYLGFLAMAAQMVIEVPLRSKTRVAAPLLAHHKIGA